MINDPAVVGLLTSDLLDELPFRVGLTRDAMKMMRKEKISFQSRPVVTDIIYISDDEGGIMCGLEFPDKEGGSALGYYISITHVKLPRKLGCYREATRYQKRRLKRLRRSSEHEAGIRTWHVS